MIDPFLFSSDSEPSSTSEVDNLLAGAGYRVRSSDLRHVAHSLELLDSATLAPSDPSPSNGVHYNPSDLTAWVDSMLQDASPSSPSSSSRPSSSSTCMLQIYPPPNHHSNILHFDSEEDTGIRLIHLLMTCADSIQRSNLHLAVSLIEEMKLVLTRVSTGFAIGKVAGCFLDALNRRIYSSPNLNGFGSLAEFELLYHHFYEACPYLKFAHFTANQAILEAFEGHDCVHVIDFNLMHGLQWPALIQALALRPGRPPFLRITGIGPPSPDGRDSLREVGLRLAELARSLNVRFAFRGVAANRLDDVKPWMLQVAAGEAVAVNSVMQLHKLVGDSGSGFPEPIDTVLSWIAGLKPKIMTVVEQEADHNKPVFLDRFTEALFYYSTVFDSLEVNRCQQSNQLAELYLQREICNIVCCEGADRVERHEPLAKWRERLGQAGLDPVHLGSNAYKQASMLLTLYSGEGYGVDEVDGCLMLGWHSRALISASAWRVREDDVAGGGGLMEERGCFGNGSENNLNGSSSSSGCNNSSNISNLL